MPDIETDAGKKQPKHGLSRARFGLWLLAGLAGAAGLLLYVGTARQPSSPASNYADTFGGPFTLTAPDGSTVTEKTLKGKPYAIFFGFTRCPDVCPTTLARMARLRKALGPEGTKFNIVFVSVDPGHDKPADIGSYVGLFGTPVIGLTGTDTQLTQIKKGFGVFVEKVPQPGGDYTIDHTAAVYLMDRDGAFVSTIDHDESDQMALAKFKRLIG
jgi:protein SCO1